MNTWSLLMDAQTLQDLTDQRRDRLAAQWGRRVRLTWWRAEAPSAPSGTDAGPRDGHDLAA